jgi:SAM-dependent methyltransferase
VCEAARVHIQSPTPAPGLTLPGERTLPGIAHENYWFRRHEVTYRAIVPYCREADVLDAGSGEGYGGELIRAGAKSQVVALDLDEHMVGQVRSRYPALLPVRGSLSALPFADGAFDAVVCMNVFERIWDQKSFVRECVRMLRPVGTLMLSTINRLTAPRPDTGAGADDGQPGNLFHIREFAPDELVDLLDSWFNVTRVLGVCHGPRILDWEAEHGSVVAAQLAGPPESWTTELHELVASLTADDFEVSPADTDGALDILVVGMRR